MMICEERTDSIVARLKEAQDDKDWARISEILDESNENDIKSIESFIPELTEHHKWLIRASAVEIIGDFHMRQLVESVRERLEDEHPVVRAFALMAYYDLLGRQALSTIEELCGAENVGLRFTALALYYIETGNKNTLERFSRILTTKQQHPKNCYTTVNIFDRYYEI